MLNSFAHAVMAVSKALFCVKCYLALNGKEIKCGRVAIIQKMFFYCTVSAVTNKK